MNITHNLTKCTLLILALVLLVFIPQATHADEEMDKLTASDPEEKDWFGFSVAVDGTIVVVGVPGDDDVGIDSGATYVYDCSSFPCTQISKLTASDTADARFGYSVAISETTVVVGAYGNDDTGAYSGAAYIYDCSDLSCTEVSQLTASDAATNDRFGFSVAVHEAMVVVGAPGNNHDGNDSDSSVWYSGLGAAYVYDCSRFPCKEVSKLTAFDAAAGDLFGYSVVVDKTTVVVGAHWDNHGDNDANWYSGAGSAYVYDCSSFPCTQTSKLMASDAADGDFFGFTIAVEGTMVVVGASGNDRVGYNSGSTYIYDCTIVPCTESKLTASDAALSDSFGGAVAVSGTVLVVGATFGNGSIRDSGTAYVFDCSDTSCKEISKLIASDPVADDLFGGSVAMDGTLVVIGAYGDDDGGWSSGAVYVFDISPNQ